MGMPSGLGSRVAFSVVVLSSVFGVAMAWRTQSMIRDQEEDVRKYDPRGPMRDYLLVPGVVTYRGATIGLCIYRGSPDQNVRELTQQVLNAIDAMQDQTARHERARAEAEETAKTGGR